LWRLGRRRVSVLSLSCGESGRSGGCASPQRCRPTRTTPWPLRRRESPRRCPPACRQGAVRGYRQHVVHGHHWRDPSGSDLFRSTLAVGASSAALTVMLLTSLLLVSLASAASGDTPVAPVAKPGAYPQWMGGPTGGADELVTQRTYTSECCSPRRSRRCWSPTSRRLLGGTVRPVWVLGAIVTCT